LTVRIPRVETAETVASLKKPLPTRYAVGQRVRAFVLSADAARRRMIVTLRTPAGRAGALFTLFRPELGLWVGTFHHVILQSNHQFHDSRYVWGADWSAKAPSLDTTCTDRTANMTYFSDHVTNLTHPGVPTLPAGRTVAAGAKLAGTVSKIVPGGGGIFVQLNSRQFGRVHVTDIADDPRAEPWKRFKVGEVVEVRVVGDVGEGGEVDLSLRASHLKGGASAAKKSSKKGKAEEDDADGGFDSMTMEKLAPGAAVTGFVKQCTKGGCFVAISRSVDARVKLCNLADDFVADPSAAFPKGKLVTGVILSVDISAGRAEMTMRTDGQDGGAKSAVNDAPVEEGTTQMGTVRRAQTYGVFVTLDGSGRALALLTHVILQHVILQ
jgi:ribosomal protein S1